MSRILVTGAGGFVGRHVLVALEGRGHDVHAVRRPVRGRRTEPVPGARIRWHSADLLDIAAARALLAEVAPTHVLHLAWEATPGVYWTSADNLLWVSASVALAEAHAESGGTRFVMAGSAAEHACAPRTLYGACKRAASDRIATTAGLSTATGRLFQLYGPGEPEERLVPTIVARLLAGEPAHLGRGTELRDFIYVEDAARALVALVESDVTGPVDVATGHPSAVRDVALGVARRLGRPDLLRFGSASPAGGPARAPEALSLVADTRRLELEVGFSARLDLDAGLDRTIAWWRDSRPRRAS